MALLVTAVVAATVLLTAPRSQDPDDSRACYSADPAGFTLALRACQTIGENPQLVKNTRARAWVERARWHLRLEDVPRAFADAEQAVRIDPSFAGGWAVRGFALLEQGDAEGAINDLSEALRAEGGIPEWRMWRAEAFRASGQGDRALVDLDEAVTLAPGVDILRLQRSDLNMELKNYDAAIADADRAAQMAPPPNAIYHNQRCWSRAVADRQLDIARAACDLALEHAPGDAAILDSRALVSFRQGRFEDAWTDYDASLRHEPNNAGSLYGRGLSALRMGRTAEGRADMDRAVRVDARVASLYAEMGLRPE